jgi:transposase
LGAQPHDVACEVVLPGAEHPEQDPLLHLPPYSPELNPVERLWAYLKSHYLSNRVFDDYNHLLDQAGHAWRQLDESRLRSLCHTEWVSAGAK